MSAALSALRYHVTGAIERGEREPIIEQRCAGCADPVNHPHAFDCPNA